MASVDSSTAGSMAGSLEEEGPARASLDGEGHVTSPGGWSLPLVCSHVRVMAPAWWVTTLVTVWLQESAGQLSGGK